jgi:hypothetical protein
MSARILVRAAIGVAILVLLLAVGGSIALHRILETVKLKTWVNGEPD